jgi:AAA+ superfamily predicted ATPase
MAATMTDSAEDLSNDLDWLASLLEARLAFYFATPSESPALDSLRKLPPELHAEGSAYAEYIVRNELSTDERLVILLALAPHFRPQVLDVLWSRNQATQRGFSEFGGVNTTGNAFLPTIQTALFLLAGDDLVERLRVAPMFEPGQPLAKLDILHAATSVAGEPSVAAGLQISQRFLGRITRGTEMAPRFDQQFPARQITTDMSWEDLVLPELTLLQLEEIRSWIQHGDTLLYDWGMAKRIRPGFTSLFFGPPGTGKTMSACLLGKLCGCDVYRIDLSMVVSKYIGETEKNLSRVFDQAENRNWILFFDEADALFGKRTQVTDSHDRYANQEVSYLLQRIEEFSGVVILASNIRANIDDAFLRRFQSVVHFPMPKATERARLWREAFPKRATVDPRLDFVRLGERHELSGGTIMNVARYSALRALSRGSTEICAEDVDDGIRRELLKEGRAF